MEYYRETGFFNISKKFDASLKYTSKHTFPYITELADADDGKLNHTK